AASCSTPSRATGADAAGAAVPAPRRGRRTSSAGSRARAAARSPPSSASPAAPTGGYRRPTPGVRSTTTWATGSRVRSSVKASRSSVASGESSARAAPRSDDDAGGDTPARGEGGLLLPLQRVRVRDHGRQTIPLALPDVRRTRLAARARQAPLSGL